ncbi:hypothetical protein PanWU01x14_285180 [Parasponia andersonii]|uniref:Uncharacterized protein n=1 Tax=Parasponia andersonii TaxID=3476 RepID=A0A2P5AZR7_PARAD|nr:hypothetical protein PanWU01x14_285180 [Parasponia andersonii]
MAWLCVRLSRTSAAWLAAAVKGGVPSEVGEGLARVAGVNAATKFWEEVETDPKPKMDAKMAWLCVRLSRTSAAWLAAAVKGGVPSEVGEGLARVAGVNAATKFWEEVETDREGER